VALSAGDVLDGRYRITDFLGRGGMGEVWAARRLDDERDVAVKVLHERASRKRDIVARFRREARATARVHSPFVCGLLGSGLTPWGGTFLVFERLRGESLSDRLRRELFLPFAELCHVMLDVWQGIAHAHAAGVLHRDMKPGNIFITRLADGAERACILDFGVSKLLDTARGNDEPSLTAYDGTVGSFAYMAPEQVRGAARVDERADIYATGAVAFRSLTGRLPFEGVTAKMVVSMKLGQPAPTLESVTGQRWPAALERFFARALAREPAERFSAAGEAFETWQGIGGMFERARGRAAGASAG
jgi:serine/threonine-protein kinase